MIFDGKTSDRPEKLKDVLELFFNHYHIPLKEQSLKDWALYINQRRMDHLDKIIRPRSQYTFLNKKSVKPELSIIHQVKEWIILNKPCGLSTQKTLKASDENLYDQLRLRLAIEKNFPHQMPYVGLHHRLDRETSGLVFMSLKREVNKEISDLFLRKKIHKEYVAQVAWGDKKPPTQWTIKNRLKNAYHPNHSFFFQVCSPDDESGVEAITHFTYQKSSSDHTFHTILCKPITGRTHQLRVQLSDLGYPILGDPVYGDKNSAPQMRLHARGLKFRIKDQDYEFKSQASWDLNS